MTRPGQRVTERLSEYGRFGISLGLETIQALLAKLGQPQAKIPIIHVAGTNGKGSVCAYLTAILTANGYRVGGYTSPHLIDWTERITLNQRPIAAENLDSILAEIIPLATTLPHPPTQFELITAAAWVYFAQQQVDLAVIEVGLGGRLDATNVCETSLVSIITSIGWDHWQRLGNTLGAIAFEKAGILKPQCPGIIGPLPPEADRVIRHQAQLLGAPLTVPEPVQKYQPESQASNWGTWREYQFPLPLAGDVQLMNLALALAAIETLKTQAWQFTKTKIIQGIGQTQWPGRLQRIHWHGLDFLVDGAHNQPAAAALREYLDQQHLGTITWMIGILKTKDALTLLKLWLRPDDRVYFLPIPDHAAFTPTELSDLAKQECPGLGDCFESTSLTAALTHLQEHPPLNSALVLTGSLYLVGEFLRLCRSSWGEPVSCG